MILTLKVENAAGEVLAKHVGTDGATLVYAGAYQPGDRIVLEADSPGGYLIAALEDSIAPAYVYMGGLRHVMTVPFGEKCVCYSPRSFSGEGHLLSVRRATRREVGAYKNVALNPLDCHENEILFPHSRANVETRGESVFASRNAVDGIYANAGHGPWPYQSWGINRDPDAKMTIDFGRAVFIDRAVLTTRADFPHDSWWVSGALVFSDGSAVTFPLTKTERPQIVEFAPRTATWVALERLIKADDESPFPALSQIEIWGAEAGCDPQIAGG
ncbi:MAG: carbohydrate-binding protein [Oscillospiraceae bacterium]|nr:carbohydrate-binding protein [Oscillospiraceae bacterium]